MLKISANSATIGSNTIGSNTIGSNTIGPNSNGRPAPKKPLASSLRRPVVAPGLIWGDYPQRDESKIDVRGFATWFDRVERRRGGIERIDTLARQALTLSTQYQTQCLRNPELRISIPANLRLRLMRDGLLDQHCMKALAWITARVRELLQIDLHPNQLVCALHLLNQSLAEMATGEGKTLAAASAAAVLALAGAPVHVLTANDYLAERDAQSLEPLFADLGLTVASALDSHSLEQRRAQYRADVVYATAKTLAFDYLRDRLQRGSHAAAMRREPLAVDIAAQGDSDAGANHEAIAGRASMLRGLCCAIIDEADSILLDEAKTPLIIADAHNDPQERGRLWQALDLARSLAAEQDFRVLKAERQIHLTAAGLSTLSDAAERYGGAWLNALHRQELVTQALTAVHLLIRDVDYIVRDREVVIVDPTTGRTAEGRQWSMGLHALVALKEQLPLPVGSRTLASLTYPRLFTRYHHLCGLSGTLLEDRRELMRTYGLQVRPVERHKPLRRQRGPVLCFADRDQQFEAARRRATELAGLNRPVLIATDSVEDSNALARTFEAHGQAVTVLNASQTANEAQTIAQAGEPGRITIATQVAGRGTDIRLAAGVADQGGLHVLSLQLNRSGRIDRQIEGRCARQGDRGSSEHWIRIAQSPLQAGAAPGLLQPLLTVLAPLASARLTERGPRAPTGGPWSAKMLLGGYQQYCRSEDANNRRQILKNDQDWSNRLHFAALIE